MHDVPAALLGHVDRDRPGDVVGLYLHGSAATWGLRPDSDVDLLMLTRRSLDADERAALVALLLRVSGWSGHAERFPAASGRRPIELTSLVVDDLRPLTRTPRRDFQYDEWLREDDERNALLTLARILVTLETGRIVSKAMAADTIAPTLRPAHRALLERAAAGYRGTIDDDWTGLGAAVAACARALAARAAGSVGGAGARGGGQGRLGA